jgi:hypothetical protein
MRERRLQVSRKQSIAKGTKDFEQQMKCFTLRQCCKGWLKSVDGWMDGGTSFSLQNRSTQHDCVHYPDRLWRLSIHSFRRDRTAMYTLLFSSQIPLR